MDIKGKVIIITGASMGIGEAALPWPLKPARPKFMPTTKWNRVIRDIIVRQDH